MTFFFPFPNKMWPQCPLLDESGQLVDSFCDQSWFSMLGIICCLKIVWCLIWNILFSPPPFSNPLTTLSSYIFFFFLFHSSQRFKVTFVFSVQVQTSWSTCTFFLLCPMERERESIVTRAKQSRMVMNTLTSLLELGLQDVSLQTVSLPTPVTRSYFWKLDLKTTLGRFRCLRPYNIL